MDGQLSSDPEKGHTYPLWVLQGEATLSSEGAGAHPQGDTGPTAMPLVRGTGWKLSLQPEQQTPSLLSKLTTRAQPPTGAEGYLKAWLPGGPLLLWGLLNGQCAQGA